MDGGREIFTICDHYVYKQPVQDATYFGCALAGQVMRWNGNVAVNGDGDKQVVFYDVDFYRMHQAKQTLRKACPETKTSPVCRGSFK